MSKTPSVRRALVLPDLHIPSEDRRTLKAVEEYMGTQCWDWVIYLGDFLDLACLAVQNKNNLRKVEGARVKKEAEAGRVILRRHRGIVGPNTQMILFEGNHDYRAEKYIDANPEVEGLMDVPTLLDLRSVGVTWKPYWSKGDVFRIGKATFGHGYMTGRNHAEAHCRAYGDSFFYGHTHDTNAYSVQTMGDDKVHYAQSLGCLQEYQPEWRKGRPSKWIQAFATFFFFPDGFYTHYVTHVFKHRFVGPDGRVYQG